MLSRTLYIIKTKKESKTGFFFLCLTFCYFNSQLQLRIIFSFPFFRRVAEGFVEFFAIFPNEWLF